MRKLSITLLLVASTFMALSGSTLSTQKTKCITIKKWAHQQRSIAFIPISATVNDNEIEVQFLQTRNHQVTFQIKDKHGIIVFQDMLVPNEQEIYKIKLDGFNAGEYELVYIEDKTTYIGDFQVD